MGMELVDKQFDTELTGHRSTDGVINATNERRRSNRKKCRDATYLNPEVKFHISSTTKGARSSLVP